MLNTFLLIAMRLCDTSLQIKRKFLFIYPVYANNRYAINHNIFFSYFLFWLRILKSYALKRFMRLTGMRLAKVFCMYNVRSYVLHSMVDFRHITHNSEFNNLLQTDFLSAYFSTFRFFDKLQYCR